MTVELHRCPACARYSMTATCPSCGQATAVAHPPKYSPQDKWADYRRKAKYG